MSLYVYVCMYACMSAHIYACMYDCVYTYVQNVYIHGTVHILMPQIWLPHCKDEPNSHYAMDIQIQYFCTSVPK